MSRIVSPARLRSGAPSAAIPQDAKNAPPARNPVYILGVMSNELKTNAADAHERLAGAVYELMLR